VVLERLVCVLLLQATTAFIARVLHHAVLLLQAASRVAAVAARGSGMQRFMAAGLQVGATLLASKVKQMHDEAMAAPPPAPAAAVSASGPGVSSGSSTGMQLWNKLLSSQPALFGSKATEAAAQQACINSSSQEAPLQAAGQKQQQQQQLEEEQQASCIMLYSPGKLYLLKRTGGSCQHCNAAVYACSAGPRLSMTQLAISDTVCCCRVCDLVSSAFCCVPTYASPVAPSR
jgi:hypothetical protein